jgi:hypothetical protein
VTRGRAVRWAAALPLYLAVATALGFVDYHVRPHPEDGFTKYSPSVVAGTAEAPGRYRILAPYALEGLRRLTGLAPRENWVAFRWLCLFGALIVGHVYFSTWFDRSAAVFGNLVMASLLPLTFTNGWPNPDQFTELLLFTLGCLCVARQWHVAFLVVLAINAFNRETSIFLLLLYGLALPITRQHVVRTVSFGVIWAAIFVGLRWRLGYQSYDIWQWSRNVQFLTPLPPNYDPYYRVYGWFFAALIAPLAWMSATTWAQQPRFLRVAAAVVAPALLVTGFLISSVIETRIFTPALPLLIPAAMRAFFDPAGRRLAAEKSA